jgi:hypothetical protein
MKRKIFTLFLLVAFAACNTGNQPVSDSMKEKITGELKPVVKAFMTTLESCDPKQFLATLEDSPDFIASANGMTVPAKDIPGFIGMYFGNLKNQEGNILEEKYVVLDPVKVLYSQKSKWKMNFKDGSSVLQAPWVFECLWVKKESGWKVAYMSESGKEKVIKAADTPALNQTELAKQFIGKWIGETGKDTTYIWEVKNYGNGMEGSFTMSAKGKPFTEGKQLFGYDNLYDHTVITELTKDQNIAVYSLKFTSPMKYIMLYYTEHADPTNASMKCEGEFTSPVTYTQTYFVNGQPVRSESGKKVK